MPEAKPRDPSHRPPRGPSFWIVAFILIFSPLPFASVEAVWTQVYGLLIALALAIHVGQQWSRDHSLPDLPRPLLIAAGLVAMVAVWGYIQSVPGLFPSWQHPVWSETAERLQDPTLPGYLSLTPDRSHAVASHYLMYIGFGLLVAWHSRRQRNLELLLKLFLGAQAAYALYGLVVYFSGLNLILWFDKAHYKDLLTSTFVNRNSYATYAGLGALTALTIALRYLRRTLVADRSKQTKIRDFIETLTSTGGAVPVILLMCCVALLLTQSRMGLTAVLVAAIALLLVWTARLTAGSTRRVGTALLTLLVMLLGVNFVLSGGLTAERFTLLFERGDGRFQIYPLMLEAIHERPWTGYGLGSFESAFRLFRDASVDSYFSRGHSDYLELLMDVGWPAAIAMWSAFLTLFLGASYLAWTRSDYELPLLSAAVTLQIALHSTVDFSMQIPPVVFAYLFLAIAAFGPPRRPTKTDAARMAADSALDPAT